MTDFHRSSNDPLFSQSSKHIPLSSIFDLNQIEFAFAYPRYNFEGDRPSQTNNFALSYYFLNNNES